MFDVICPMGFETKHGTLEVGAKVTSVWQQGLCANGQQTIAKSFGSMASDEQAPKGAITVKLTPTS